MNIKFYDSQGPIQNPSVSGDRFCQFNKAQMLMTISLVTIKPNYPPAADHIAISIFELNPILVQQACAAYKAFSMHGVKSSLYLRAQRLL